MFYSIYVAISWHFLHSLSFDEFSMNRNLNKPKNFKKRCGPTQNNQEPAIKPTQQVILLVLDYVFTSKSVNDSICKFSAQYE